ncbi:MAG: NAD-dependent epimerase/dehydratase family protein [Bryobacterales bacterium]|nr:NAD-dependent epimerase/dehydratase family protein [Bryobacterales bacterium]
MGPRRKIIVIGGTLFIGRNLVSRLVKERHDVTILHRKPGHDLGPKVRELVADRNDPAALTKAIAGREFDVVFDNVYDFERGTSSAQVEATARAFGDKLHRYVFISSVAAYGGGLNHYEGDGLVTDDNPDLYARNKAMSERVLFRLHQRYGFPAVTLRPPFVYGPGNPYYREQFFWDRLRDKKPWILPGDGRRLMQFAYVHDVVAACLAAMEEPGAVGHAFNIANARSTTQADLLAALAAAAGPAAAKHAQITRMSRELIYRMGGHPMGPKLYFGLYYDLPPITMLIAKAQRILKFKPTDFALGLKESHKWWKAAPQSAPDYSFEEQLLERVKMGEAGT